MLAIYELLYPLFDFVRKHVISYNLADIGTAGFTATLWNEHHNIQLNPPIPSPPQLGYCCSHSCLYFRVGWWGEVFIKSKPQKLHPCMRHTLEKHPTDIPDIVISRELHMKSCQTS